MIKKSNEQSNQYQSTLAYYKDKVDALKRERQDWLAKFDQCNSKLQNKHHKQHQLKKLKDQTSDTHKSIIHHTAALFDERAFAINQARENLSLEFDDAQQILKMKELAQQFPNVLDKQLPCTNVILTDEVIKNDLNIHSTEKFTKKPNKKSTKSENKSENKKMVKGTPTIETLLKQQIIQTKNLNDQEIRVMEEQAEALQQMIKEVKEKQKDKIHKGRGVNDELNKKYKQLEKEHKKLAQTFFENKRKRKYQLEALRNENEALKKTQLHFQEKINHELKVYEKQNKAKQTLIMRRSQDFQQDYKARMRAKERNLQALRENYEKMQQLCITKVRKLEATVEKAKNMLRDAEESRRFTVEELREELRILQKKSSEQRIEKIKLDNKVKQKLQEKRLRQQQEQQKFQKTKKTNEKNKKLLSAYQQTTKPIKRQKSKPRPKKQPESDEDSLDMSALDKIKQQINKLEQKIAQQDKND